MSRAESGVQICKILMLLLVAAGLTYAATPDRHLQNDPGASLYRQSAFAHGFIHGYEDGFHPADEDFQLARAERDITTSPEYRSAESGYRGEFGEKELFRAGYRQGLESGYSDSSAGRPFRAIAAARAVSQDLVPAADRRGFELGFARGYQAERLSENSAGSPAVSDCNPEDPAPSQHQAGSDFCRGFSRGFRFAQLYDGREAETLALQ